MKYTSNLKLRLPAGSDMFNIEDFNANAETLDAAIKTNVLAISSNQSAIAGNAAAIKKNSTEITRLTATVAGKQTALGFTPVQQGGGAKQQSNKIYLGWDNSALRVQVDSTDLGAVLTDGAANAAVLPISKGGTGADTADGALSAITKITSVSLDAFCTKMAGNEMSGTARKIGNRMLATVRITGVTSSASAAGQILQINAAYRPHATFSGASVGCVTGHVRADGRYYNITGYINANNSRNGIVTCIFPGISTSYEFVDLYFDYVC